MAFYFGIFILLALFTLPEYLGMNLRQRNVLFVAFSALMFCLSFLRWEVGTDWDAYNIFFQSSDRWFAKSHFEWGFSIINQFSRIVLGTYTGALFVLGTILFLFQSNALWRLSPYPLISLLYIWAVLLGNILFVRQDIAMMITLFSVIFIVRRKFLPFLLCVILAGSIHRTAYVFILAWWLYRMRIPRLWLWIGIGISLVMTAVTKTVMENIAGIFGPLIQLKIDLYLEEGSNTMGSNSSILEIMVRGFANKIVIFLALLTVRIDDRRYRGFTNLYWFGILLYFTTIGISTTLSRITRFYDILAVILLPILLSRIKNEYKSRIAAFAILLIYLSMRLYVALNGSYSEELMPYKTFFSVS